MIRAVLFDCIGVLYIRKGVLDGLAPNKELLDFSQSLRPRYKIGLLTNLGAESLYKYFTQEEVKKYFDSLVVSGEVGLVKPERGIYERTAHNLGLLIDECVLIDDSLANCEGAKKAGMHAILYQSTAQTQQDLARLLQ